MVQDNVQLLTNGIIKNVLVPLQAI